MASTSSHCAGPWFQVYINILGGKKKKQPKKAMQTAISHTGLRNRRVQSCSREERGVQRLLPKAGTRRLGPSGCTQRGPSPAVRPGQRLCAPREAPTGLYLSLSAVSPQQRRVLLLSRWAPPLARHGDASDARAREARDARGCAAGGGGGPFPAVPAAKAAPGATEAARPGGGSGGRSGAVRGRGAVAAARSVVSESECVRASAMAGAR